MLKELKDNIVSLIEIEKDNCPTVYAMYKANKDKTVEEIYQTAIKSDDASVLNAIYDLENAYGD